MLHDDGSADLSEDELNNLIKVAILDTGVDLTHPAFKDFRETGRLENGIDLVDPSNEHGVVDLDGHGTHMCHTLLQTAPYAKVYPIRVFTHHETLDENSSERGLGPQDKNPRIDSAARVAKVGASSCTYTYPDGLLCGTTQPQLQALTHQTLGNKVGC